MAPVLHRSIKFLYSPRTPTAAAKARKLLSVMHFPKRHNHTQPRINSTSTALLRSRHMTPASSISTYQCKIKQKEIFSLKIGKK
jgi:hypothetical protein